MIYDESLRPEFERAYGKDKQTKEGEWLDMNRLPHGQYRSMVTHYAWHAYNAAHLKFAVHEVSEPGMVNGSLPAAIHEALAEIERLRRQVAANDSSGPDEDRLEFVLKRFRHSIFACAIGARHESLVRVVGTYGPFCKSEREAIDSALENCK